MDRDHCMYNVQWFIDKKYFTGSSMYNTGTGTIVDTGTKYCKMENGTRASSLEYIRNIIL